MKRSVLTWLLVGFGSSLFAQSESAVSPVSSAPPPPAEIHDFDFWLGSWEVVTPDGKLVGHNHIEAILGGRVLRENYTTPGTYAGRSFNIYNAAAQRWEQYWVDVTGLALHLTGGLNPAGQMVLQGKRVTPAGTSIVDRITWTPQADGTVRQFWETSSDGGETWAPAFDGRYRPVAPPTP